METLTSQRKKNGLISLRDVLSAPLMNLYLLQEIQLVLDNLPPQLGGKFLDVGCGAGVSSLIFTRSAKHVMGIDISRPIIEFAQQFYKSTKLSFQCVDLCVPSAELDVHEFDAGICIDTLGYVSSPAHALEFIARHLRPDGYLVLTTPSRSPLGRNEFTREDIVSLVEANGFVAEVKTLSPTRSARFLGSVYDFFQRIGADRPISQHLLEEMESYRFEDVARPAWNLMRSRSRYTLLPLNLGAYILFLGCRGSYEESPEGSRFLVIGRKR